MFPKISAFWLKNINPRLVTLITSVSTLVFISWVLSLLVVFYLFEEIKEQEYFDFDKSFLLGLHQYSNHQLDTLMLLITKLGDPKIVLPLVIVTLVILWWKKYRLEASIFTIGCLGAEILNVGLKLLFGRSRPQLWTSLISETSFSFPSGHALGSLFLYGFISYLLAKIYPSFSKLIYTIASILIIIIGFSRLYLGVHWPTDIIAGYGIGFIWLIICITMLKLQKRRSTLKQND